ncbi:MAG: LicD family protein [Bacteroidota bacterium]|nr:LicD family protein [Bacteroidota bacterium]
MAILKTNRGPYKFKQLDLFLGKKQINKEIARDNILDIKKILDKGDLYFGLINGTLLGAVREHDFISHDEDTDLFVLSEEEEKLKLLFFDMKESGFDLIRYDRRGLYSVMRYGEYIDFYIFRPFQNGVRYSGSDYVLEKHLSNTIEIYFQDEKFRVPADYVEFLEIYYGNNWQTPIVWTTYDLSRFQIFREKLIVKIKRALPNKLFEKLQYAHAIRKRELFFYRIKAISY